MATSLPYLRLGQPGSMHSNRTEGGECADLPKSTFFGSSVSKLRGTTAYSAWTESSPRAKPLAGRSRTPKTLHSRTKRRDNTRPRVANVSWGGQDGLSRHFAALNEALPTSFIKNLFYKIRP